ncbi:hypothetical protein [Flavisolibacter ginsenosidimutans]|uniref:Uncharacterized protein n=1 Tax=Flavisolibacter ginsenosidimutans TaxID=661481 RepID=A0A5B8UJR1_9BACT|nr:hypothetical protein [Flavisolibacter ginsenosidimutans]QEC56646.1 hypothetical protein FSB75_12320 [Flavisolibacter ginsenosidimutans]
MATIQFIISRQEAKYFASTNDFKFYVGTETVYQGQHGLFNYNRSDGPIYKPEDFETKYSNWAWFIQPTASCESKGSFHCLNTYDRAAFTFTFMQFAAHVPNGDFVTFFRALLILPEAKDYFPFLELRDGRIWYVKNQTATQLEDSTSTAPLMKYLNSDISNIDDQEVITAARFVHWAQNSDSHRSVQVNTAIDLFKNNMKEHSIRFNLDGWPDYICQTICDIFHQGRAKYRLVSDIISGNSDREVIYNKLINIGNDVYANRIETLKTVHRQLRESGKFGKKYNAQLNSFIP